MRDKQAFEAFVLEKSRARKAEIQRRRKTMLTAGMSLCICMIAVVCVTAVWKPWKDNGTALIPSVQTPSATTTEMAPGETPAVETQRPTAIPIEPETNGAPDTDSEDLPDDAMLPQATMQPSAPQNTPLLSAPPQATMPADDPVSDESTSNGEDSTTPPVNPGMPPPQPIRFDNFSEALAFIKANDCTDYENYPDTYQIAYKNMLETFLKDGFVFRGARQDATPLLEVVTLYPEVTNEDAGIAYWFQWNTVEYQIMIYHTKKGDEYKINIENESYADYELKRFGKLNASAEIVENSGHEIFKTIYMEPWNNKLGAYCMIDSSHYIAVRADVEKDTLIAFINGLQLEKEVINDE